MIRKGWGDPKGLSIVDIATNTFIFNFPDAETPCRILVNAPWNILGQVLILKQWCPQVAIQEVEYSYTPYWIQIHGMPLELFSKENAGRAGSRIGKVLEVEDPFQGTSIIRSFLRVRVLLNIKNPLIAGFWIPRHQLPKVWIQVKYEKLMDFCYNCGRLGHEQKGCKHKKAINTLIPNKPIFGPWMSTPPLKKFTSYSIKAAEDGTDEDGHMNGEDNQKPVNGEKGEETARPAQEDSADHEAQLFDENGKKPYPWEEEPDSTKNIHHNGNKSTDTAPREGNMQKGKAKIGSRQDQEDQDVPPGQKSNLETRVEMVIDSWNTQTLTNSRMGSSSSNRTSSCKAHYETTEPNQSKLFSAQTHINPRMSSNSSNIASSLKAQYETAEPNLPNPPSAHIPYQGPITSKHIPMGQTSKYIPSYIYTSPETKEEKLSIQIWEPRNLEKIESPPKYFVQFPDEDDSNSTPKNNDTVETYLSMEIHNRLKLKRRRVSYEPALNSLNDDQGSTEKIEENKKNEAQYNIRKKPRRIEDDKTQIHTHLADMAEEAGLIKPPLSP